MSEGAANEARVVISTDWSSFKEFLEASKKGLGDVKDQGKSAFGEVGKSVTDFTRSTLQGALMGVGMQLFDAVVSPLRKGFSQLIQDAEQFRAVVSRTALSAGQDFTKIEIELDQLSRKTGVKVEQLNAFVEGVRAQTGDRKAALAAVEGARKESLARGAELGDMTGEVGQLQRRYKIEDVEGFYNRQRSGAKALGLNENLAATTAARMRGVYENTGMSADQVGRFSNSLLKASGGDAEIALKAGQEFNGLVQGPESRGSLEKTLGLKQGALLDERGRPDVARAIELMRNFQLKHRGQKGLEFIARQHMSPTTADLFSRRMEEVASGYDAQRYAEDGTPLADTDRAYKNSDQGQADLNDRRIESQDRMSGAGWASYKQRVRKEAGGGGLGWLKLANPDTWPILAGGKERASDLISREVFENDQREKERTARYKQEMEKHQADVAAGRAEAPSFWRPTGSGTSIPLGGPGFTPTMPASPWADPKQLAQAQGDALGKSLQGGTPLPIRGIVQVEMVPPARVGQGKQ